MSSQRTKINATLLLAVCITTPWVSHASSLPSHRSRFSLLSRKHQSECYHQPPHDEDVWVMEEECHDAKQLHHKTAKTIPTKTKKGLWRKRNKRTQQQQDEEEDDDDDYWEEEEDDDEFQISNKQSLQQQAAAEKEEIGEEHPMRTDEWQINVRFTNTIFPTLWGKSRQEEQLVPESPEHPNALQEHKGSKRRRRQVMKFAPNGYVLLVEDYDDLVPTKENDENNDAPKEETTTTNKTRRRNKRRQERKRKQQAVEAEITEPSPQQEQQQKQTPTTKRRKTKVGKWKVDHTGVSWDIPVTILRSPTEQKRLAAVATPSSDGKTTKNAPGATIPSSSSWRNNNNNDDADFLDFACVAAGGNGFDTDVEISEDESTDVKGATTKQDEDDMEKNDLDATATAKMAMIPKTKKTVLHYHADLHLNKFGERPRMCRGIITRDRFRYLSFLPPNIFRPVIATFSAEGIGKDMIDITYKERQLLLEQQMQQQQQQ